MWLLMTMGCLDDSFLLGNRALDYHIDRPRVVAVRVSGEWAEATTPRVVDALILSPDPVESIRVSVCGYRTDAAVQVFGMECFSNPSLVRSIGDSIPAEWTPPAIDTDCDPAQDTGFAGGRTCFSTVPVMVEVDAAGRTGRGAFFASVAAVPGFDDFVLPGDAVLLEGPDTAIAGEEVTLEARTTNADYFQWWVDDGELRDTGRTGRRSVDASTGLVTTSNRLRIPSDYEGPLRVAVVVPFGELSPAWSVHTIEVTP